jgi:hypothetical protein
MSSSAPTELRVPAVLPTAALSALVVVWYVPWSPPLPERSLDPAWRIALQIACERGLLFGTDIIFTYGPLGCIAARQYWPSAYLPGLLFWLAMASVAAILVIRATPPGLRRAIALCGLLGLGLMPDAALLALPLAVVLHGTRRPGDSTWSLAGVVAMAPLSLVKFTALPICGLAVIASALMEDQPLRSLTTRLAVFAAACAAAWLAAGQSPVLLVSYLSESFEVARGYTQAMALPPGKQGPAAILATVVAAFFVAVAAGAARALPPGIGRVRQIAWVGFATFFALIVWRQGVVRMDRFHLFPFFVIMTASALLIIAALKPQRTAAALLVAGAAAGLMLSSVDWPALFVHEVVESHVHNLVRAGSALSQLELPANERNRAFAEWRAATHDPLNGRPGTHETLGHEQHLLAVRDPALWRPRPTLQGYASYTPLLAAQVVTWIRSPAAPRWLTVRPGSIDGRWATQDDAPLWPLLRSRYAVVDRVDDALVLERRAEPLPEETTSHRSIEVQVSDWLTLPGEFQTGDVHVRITDARADAGIAGRILPGLAALFMEVRESSGLDVQRFRLVPEIAATGFLLSPDLHRADDLEAWLRGRDFPGARVTALRITDVDGRPVPARVTFGSKPFPYPSAP